MGARSTPPADERSDDAAEERPDNGNAERQPPDDGPIEEPPAEDLNGEPPDGDGADGASAEDDEPAGDVAPADDERAGDAPVVHEMSDGAPGDVERPDDGKADERPDHDGSDPPRGGLDYYSTAPGVAKTDGDGSGDVPDADGGSESARLGDASPGDEGSSGKSTDRFPILAAALLGAVAVGGLSWSMLMPATPTQPASDAPPAVPAPHLEYPYDLPPEASYDRATPPSVVETQAWLRPSWNLGYALKATEMGRTWRDHRAVIDVAGEDGPRSYAIGDLIPYGAVLVAVSTGAVQLMVGDVELVYLDVKDKLRSVQDFRTAYEPAPLRRAPTDRNFEDAVLEVLAFLRSEDPREVQGAIDALIQAGPSALGPLVPYAESAVPVATATYAFAGSEPRRPEVYGDLIVGILRAITGHSFGDPMAPGKTEEEKAWIRRQWRRWWGVR